MPQCFCLQYLARQLSQDMMQSNYGGMSRSSSAALSMAPRPSSAIFDDINIAQGLLNEPKDPRHRSSMTSINFTALDGSDDQAQTSLVPADGHPGGREHRVMRSSNTWTSSSGDVLSDHDDVDDRTIFVHEYNRLARKVWPTAIIYELALRSPSAWCSTNRSRRLRCNEREFPFPRN
jgi:hypothetical protein